MRGCGVLNTMRRVCVNTRPGGAGGAPSCLYSVASPSAVASQSNIDCTITGRHQRLLIWANLEACEGEGRCLWDCERRIFFKSVSRCYLGNKTEFIINLPVSIE